MNKIAKYPHVRVFKIGTHAMNSNNFTLKYFNPNPHGLFSNLIHMGRAYHKPSQY